MLVDAAGLEKYYRNVELLGGHPPDRTNTNVSVALADATEQLARSACREAGLDMARIEAVKQAMAAAALDVGEPTKTLEFLSQKT